MSVIKGKDAILYWKVDGIFAPIACMESCNVTTNTELAETSTVQTGIYRTYRGNRNTWTVSAAGVCSFDSNHPHVKLRLLQQSMTPVFIMFTAIDDNGLAETFTGFVLITSLPTDSSATDFYRYSIEATGTGEYTITDIPVDPNECCQDAWYYYTGVGTENYSITLTTLKNKEIAGRIYRDGIEYRPSGVDYDGAGTPVGKQFKFEKALGKLTFDSSLPVIALGEQIDIPYNLCGGSIGCDIQISNVMVSWEVSDGLFHIMFLPLIGDDITAPDEIRVRYSADNGESWQTIEDITYDPDNNYQEVVINEEIDPSENYLFEVTPVCNGVAGSSGIGTYVPETCYNVTNLAVEKDGNDITFSFTGAVTAVDDYTVNLIDNNNDIVATQTITENSGVFEDVPNIDDVLYRVEVTTNCANGLHSSGTSEFTNNTYVITYTNNAAIQVAVHIGNNGGSPSTTLVDEVYPGSSGIRGASSELPLTNGIVVLDITGTGKTLINANCNGIPAVIDPGDETATWLGVEGGVYISFIST